jgi:hypothetical protein
LVTSIEALADLVGLVPLGQLHFLGLAHELAGQLLHAFREGGGEHHGLAFPRALLGDEHHVVEEAHVQHAVGFVEHQGVEGVQVQAAPLQVVHDAPGVPTTMWAPCSRLAIWGRMVLPPHQGKDLDVVLGPGQAADFLGDLVGQLAGRAQHQGLHGEAARFRLASRGRAKAAVLPLPVLAWAIRSLPARVIGRLAAWIGVMVR